MSTTASTGAKRRLYEQFARIGKALASPSRLQLLDLLAQGERPVEALARETGLTVANTSQHLRLLHAARLVDTRRDRQSIFYRVAGPAVETLWQSLRQTAEAQLAELDGVASDYLAGRDEFEAIDRAELVRRLKAGSVTLIDVRPAEEYDQSHIEGAHSVPLDQLKKWARSAPRGRQIVAYCRGPYCVFALQAVAELRRRGFRALRLEEGVLEWRAAGLPVARRAGGSA